MSSDRYDKVLRRQAGSLSLRADKKVHWGLLGCARICRRGLIPGLRASRWGELAAIASRDSQKGAAWAREFDIPLQFGSYEDLLADPSVEAVYVPLPNHLHLPYTIAAAEAGKHVLCEKPLALTAAQAREMAAACQQHGVLLMEAFMYRHHPRMVMLKRLLEEGRIGPLRLIRSSFSFTIVPDDWRLNQPMGGGALWDLGCYGVNLARLLTGNEPQAVQATARFTDAEVDKTVLASLHFPDGVLAQVDCSFDMPKRNRVEVVGTDGTISLEQAFLPPEHPVLEVTDDQGRIEEIKVPTANQYALQVDHMSRAILDHTPLRPPAENGVKNMEAVERILHAARA